MRKLLFVACSLLLFGSVTMAQGKIDTKSHCPKESANYKLDVGDVPGHSYMILQGTCNVTASDSGYPEKTGVYTEFLEAWKTSFNFHGRSIMTMENGDKVYYTFEGSGSTDSTKPVSSKSKILSGTGKYKGIKGSGTCSTKSNPDGSFDMECTGTYSMGK